MLISREVLDVHSNVVNDTISTVDAFGIMERLDKRFFWTQMVAIFRTSFNVIIFHRKQSLLEVSLQYLHYN